MGQRKVFLGTPLTNFVTALLQLEAANRSVRESIEAVENAEDQLDKEQTQWNNIYEKVCLEVQKEEETRYQLMIKAS